MKILYTGFQGFNNPSKIIVNRINEDKIIFNNSYDEIDKVLLKNDIEKYDFIIMLGLRNNLKKSIRIETTAGIESDIVNTYINYKVLQEYFNLNGISCLINEKPTNYLCNYAYYKVLKRNKKAIFIHVPEFKNIKDVIS